jgi:hypothetical protein
MKLLVMVVSFPAEIRAEYLPNKKQEHNEICDALPMDVVGGLLPLPYE